nr:MAG TPA: hypothetical protein [Caudoviricetes sp.]
MELLYHFFSLFVTYNTTPCNIFFVEHYICDF